MPRLRLTPLPQAAFYILLALADDDLHGYGIMRRILEQTGGEVRLGPGTLYTSIHSLLKDKFITECDPPKSAEAGSDRRRYYRLSPGGRKVARAEATRLAGLLRAARKKDILRGDYV